RGGFERGSGAAAIARIGRFRFFFGRNQIRGAQRLDERIGGALSFQGGFLFGSEGPHQFAAGDFIADGSFTFAATDEKRNLVIIDGARCDLAWEREERREQKG